MNALVEMDMMVVLMTTVCMNCVLIVQHRQISRGQIEDLRNRFYLRYMNDNISANAKLNAEGQQKYMDFLGKSVGEYIRDDLHAKYKARVAEIDVAEKVIKEQKPDAKVADIKSKVPTYFRDGVPVTVIDSKMSSNEQKIKNTEKYVDEILKKVPDDGKSADRKSAVEQTAKKLRSFYRHQFDAQKNMLRVAEAVEVYLFHFTAKVSANPKQLKEIRAMLEATEVISKWYNASTCSKPRKFCQGRCVKC